MKFKHDIKPITFMKKHSKELVAEVNRNQRPIVITQNGEARAVLQDIDTYEKIQSTFALLKLIAQGENSFVKGKTSPDEKVWAKIDRDIAAIKTQK